MTSFHPVVNGPEFRTQHVADTHARTTYLVRIGRADTLSGRTDTGAAFGRLLRGVEHPVSRQDQVCLLGNLQAPLQIVAALGQRRSLLAEKNRVEDHPVADDVGFTALENTRRNRAQDVFFAVEFQRMTRIGTALKTRNRLITGSQHIDNLAFALIAPLQAEYDVNFIHDLFEKFNRKKTILPSKVLIFR